MCLLYIIQSNLSGGERQRIALARALIKKPEILILDEATSNLDFISESKIYKSLFKLKCTVIFVAHRLSTIRKCDNIVVIDKNQISEKGTHMELIEKKGMYYKIFNSQIGEDIEVENDDEEESLTNTKKTNNDDEDVITYE